MFSLVIADDEKHIIRLIDSLIDKETLDIEVVGTASNGIDAYNLVEKNHPDIVITDIRMPCMDGLELIEKMNMMPKRPAVIAISGYRRFEYAYGAIKGGVEDYLVKPINKNSLNDVLRKICMQSSEQKNNIVPALLNTGNNMHQELYKKIILDSLSNPNFNLNELMMNKLFQTQQIPAYYCGVAIYIDFPFDVTENSFVEDKCLQCVEEVLSDTCSELSFIWRDSTLSGVVSLSQSMIKTFERRIKQLFEHLNVVLDTYEITFISIGLGKITSLPVELSDSIRDAFEVLDTKCVLGGNRIISIEEFDGNDLPKSLTREEIDNLREIILNDRISFVPQFLDSVFDKSEIYYIAHPIETVSLLKSIEDNFTKLAKMLNVTINDEAEKKFCRHRRSCTGFADIVNTHREFIERILQDNIGSRLQRDSVPVIIAKEYIDEHIAEPFTIEILAEHVSLSSNYLNTVFKKETGMNISEFILQKRIDKAKKLLRTTNLNFIQIAEQVGYQDSKYFSKIFKKATGIPMKQYRRLYV